MISFPDWSISPEGTELCPPFLLSGRMVFYMPNGKFPETLSLRRLFCLVYGVV
jgi:hypothetical protein